MGITIHFEGELKDERSYERVLRTVRNFAQEQDWSCSSITEDEAVLTRVKDEEEWDYVGPTKGIQIQPHENSEPLRLEFDERLYVQEYIKTQFAPLDVHILVTKLLHLIKPEFSTLEVVDEGEYFETGDASILENHSARCFEVLDEYLTQEGKYYGPVRLESGRIVDLMEQE